MRKDEKEKVLFENIEDCQMAISLLMRKDAVTALGALEPETGKRLHAALSVAVSVLAVHAPPSKLMLVTPVRQHEDRFVEILEAAQILGTTRRWIYHHHQTLPFTRRMPNGRLRFSAKGMQQWLSEVPNTCTE